MAFSIARACSGKPMESSSDAALPRLLVQGGESSTEAFDVFEVVGVSGGIVHVRSAFLFEVGEQLPVRIEHEGGVSDAIARVRAHLGPELHVANQFVGGLA